MVTPPSNWVVLLCCPLDAALLVFWPIFRVLVIRVIAHVLPEGVITQT